MTIDDYRKLELPDSPGVYLFKDGEGKILYIGKATSLRDRVRSYFGADLVNARGMHLVDMVALATTVDRVETDSVLEALLLEANLIKIHQPKYNTREKDNKSHNYVVVTDEEFPQVRVMRGRELFGEDGFADRDAPALHAYPPAGGLLCSRRRAAQGTQEHHDQFRLKHRFGPFPHGAELREAMKIIRRLFPFRDEKCRPGQGRPCFNRQIRLCPGVCTGEVSKEEYAETIEDLRLLFEGRKKELVKRLEAEMNAHAGKQEFEKAASVRQTLFGLNHINDVALMKRQQRIVSESHGGGYGHDDAYRVEAYDVAHSSGTSVVGVMTVVEDGEAAKGEYRKFRIRKNPGVDDTGALKEILRRRLAHLEWHLPRLIVVDGGKAQVNAAESVLKLFGFDIPVVSVLKDERHKPKDILGDRAIAREREGDILLANAEAHRFAIAYHRKRRDRIV